MVSNKSPEPSVVAPANNLITQAELISLFVQLLGHTLSESDHDFIVKFFLKYGPFDRTGVQTRLEQIIEATGTQHHMRVYCERLMDTKTRR